MKKQIPLDLQCVKYILTLRKGEGESEGLQQATATNGWASNPSPQSSPLGQGERREKSDVMFIFRN